jgi:integration host factor subunit beta
MIRSELIDRLHLRAPTLTHDDTKAVVSEILAALSDALVVGKRIEIRDFGSFSLNFRKPRAGRNPKSGDPVQVPGKYVPTFKSGKAMRDRVNS